MELPKHISITIKGSPGAGKSSTLHALGLIFQSAGIRVVASDCDGSKLITDFSEDAAGQLAVLNPIITIVTEDGQP